MFWREKGPKLKSGKEVASSIRRELIPDWGDRPIGEISRRDVVKLLEKVVDEDRPYSRASPGRLSVEALQLGDRSGRLRAQRVADHARHRRRTSSAPRSPASAF